LLIRSANTMPVCARPGGRGRCLARARLRNVYQASMRSVQGLLERLPLVGNMATQALDQIRDGLKASLTGGMLFEEMGFRYIAPIDGHDLPSLRRWLRDVKDQDGPVLLHVLTEKGHGVPQASEDPVTYHTPPVVEKVGPERTILSLRRVGAEAATDAASNAIY